MPRLRHGIYAILDLDRIGPRLPADGRAEQDLIAAYTAAAVDNGAIAVQLRAKGWPPRGLQFAAAIGRMLAVAAGRAAVICNDALVAAQPHAGKPGLGVHVGQDDLAPATVRAALGDDGLVGLSTHTLAQVAAAKRQPIDYLGFGPIRPTDGKATEDAIVGVEGLRAAAALTAKPVIAIGGLTLDDVAAVHGAGAWGMAVIGAWLGPAGRPFDPGEAGVAMALLHATWVATAAEARS